MQRRHEVAVCRNTIQWIPYRCLLSHKPAQISMASPHRPSSDASQAPPFLRKMGHQPAATHACVSVLRHAIILNALAVSRPRCTGIRLIGDSCGCRGNQYVPPFLYRCTQSLSRARFTVRFHRRALFVYCACGLMPVQGKFSIVSRYLRGLIL